jgi:hypothetical protein
LKFFLRSDYNVSDNLWGAPLARAKAKSQASADARQRRAIMLKVDDEIRNELEVLSLARDKTVQQLGVEAICDLLKKYGRPVGLIDALQKSAKAPREKPAATPKKMPNKRVKSRKPH